MNELFLTLSLISGFVTFGLYFIEIARGTAHPHIFSWITWSLLTGLGFVLSWLDGGGAGAWIFALQSALCLVVAVWAIFRGEKTITTFDWVTFLSALAITALYLLTKNAVLSVLLVATIDCLGFAPTFRKSYAKPTEEPALAYSLSFFSYTFSILALESFSFVTVFYPAVLVVANLAFVVFLLVRRRVMVAKH